MEKLREYKRLLTLNLESLDHVISKREKINIKSIRLTKFN